MGDVTGLLIISKPAGHTSHDVVARVRRLAGQRRVGHAGTLDPLATGVLVVLLGQATRLSEYLTRHDKAYRAVVRLGATTDTDDASGRVLATFEGELPTRAVIEAALPAFRGAIEQRPPAYSAIKLGGEPMYRRARRGEEAPLASRRVYISRLEISAWTPPELVLEVECSAGTYVRALARDLGGALGCGAHLTGLIRTRSGPFGLEQAVSLDELEAQREGGGWKKRLLPLEAALPEMTVLQLTAEESRRLSLGQTIPGSALPTRLSRALDETGALVAIVEYDAEMMVWRPQKVFAHTSKEYATHP